MESLPYLTWSVSQERQRYEWMRLRRSIVGIRLGFLIGGHVAYFAFCAIAHALGRFAQYGHSIWVGFWSMALIGIALLILETLYSRMCPQTIPRFTIRKNGVTRYGDDGPAEHYDWSRTRELHIENDYRHPEFRSLILREEKRRWLPRVAPARIPLPFPGEQTSDGVDELRVIEALRHSIEESGLTWQACANGTVVLTAAA